MGNSCRRCCEGGEEGRAEAGPAAAARPSVRFNIPGDAEVEGVVRPARGLTADDELLRAALADDFSFDGQRFLAKVVDVYDGDTLRVTFRYGGRLVQYRARMAGYDSPEMKPPRSKPNRENEIAAARAAKAALERRVRDRLVTVACGPFDKYGRILVTIYDSAAAGGENGENINEWMVSSGHGVPYEGGSKAPFEAGPYDD